MDLAKFTSWLNLRIPIIKQINSFLQGKIVPRHKYSFFYIFGGLSFFFFVIQVVTGMLLALYYSPTPENANESVRNIVAEVDFGWLIRSIHAWGANFMVATVLIHMFSTYFMKAYRKPREIMWLSGGIIFFVVLGFAFTGYLLPWDTTGYFATQIGTEIPKSIPLIGNLMVKLLRGGEDIGAEALKRLFAIHTIILPIISIFIISFHVILQQVLGTSIPPKIREQQSGIRFMPNFFYRDLITWTIGFILLFGCATILPWKLGEKADPYASAPAGIKPEWYFLPLYQGLKMVPNRILSLNGEMVINIFILLSSILWLSIPFLDYKANRDENSPIFTFLGVILIMYCIISVLLAYFF